MLIGLHLVVHNLEHSTTSDRTTSITFTAFEIGNQTLFYMMHKGRQTKLVVNKRRHMTKGTGNKQGESYDNQNWL